MLRNCVCLRQAGERRFFFCAVSYGYSVHFTVLLSRHFHCWGHFPQTKRVPDTAARRHCSAPKAQQKGGTPGGVYRFCGGNEGDRRPDIRGAGWPRTALIARPASGGSRSFADVPFARPRRFLQWYLYLARGNSGFIHSLHTFMWYTVEVHRSV